MTVRLRSFDEELWRLTARPKYWSISVPWDVLGVRCVPASAISDWSASPARKSIVTHVNYLRVRPGPFEPELQGPHTQTVCAVLRIVSSVPRYSYCLGRFTSDHNVDGNSVAAF
eukprot:2199197-Pyramimonas_sp.AAC.1